MTRLPPSSNRRSSKKPKPSPKTSNKTLKRQQSLVKPYHDKRNKLEDLSNNEYTNMLVLEAEIQQIEEFIEDLKYIKE
jgi:hypothetical protein